MQAGFVFGMVIVSTFVFDRSAVRQDTETVGKARGYPQLHGRRVKGRVRRIPRRRNSQSFPPSEGGRIAAQVDHHIKDCALRYAQQLALRMLDLIVDRKSTRLNSSH